MIEHPQSRRDWFAVERRVFDDEMFAGDEFSRREAWLCLVANAAKRDHNARARDGIIELKRGEVVVGRDYLAKKWGWTPSRVRTFLNQLRAADRLEFRQSDGHHPNVAKINNYERFQSFGATPSPVESPEDRQLVASRSPHHYKEQDTKKGSSAAAGVPKAVNTKRTSSLADADREEAEGALADYNAAAGQLNFTRANATAQRLCAIVKRLRDIGQGDISAGRERFRQALQAIGHWPFLAGREKPKDGRKPFRLDLERLLGTVGGMGDVLARLIDLHDEHGPALTQLEAHARSASACADVWREAQELQIAEQNARWSETEDTGAADAAVH